MMMMSLPSWIRRCSPYWICVFTLVLFQFFPVSYFSSECPILVLGILFSSVWHILALGVLFSSVTYSCAHAHTALPIICVGQVAICSEIGVQSLAFRVWRSEFGVQSSKVEDPIRTAFLLFYLYLRAREPSIIDNANPLVLGFFPCGSIGLSKHWYPNRHTVTAVLFDSTVNRLKYS